MTPTSPPMYAPRYRDAQRHPARDTGPAKCRSTPAETASAQTLPAGRSPRILRRAGSRSLLCDRRPRRARWLLVDSRIAIDVRVELDVTLADGLRMAQEEISPWLQILIKPLHQLRLALFREINQDVHAKDAVELAHIDNLRKVHGGECNQISDPRPDNVMFSGTRKILLTLLGRDGFHFALGVDGVFGVIHPGPAYIPCQHLDVPCVGELQRVGNGHGDAVGLFAGGAARAPYTQCPRVFPEFLHVQLGQAFFLQRLKNRRIAEERCLLRQQPL